MQFRVRVSVLPATSVGVRSSSSEMDAAEALCRKEARTHKLLVSFLTEDLLSPAIPQRVPLRLNLP